MSLLKKIFFAFLLIVFSNCKENDTVKSNEYGRMFPFSGAIPPIMDSVFCEIIPIDLDSVDCFQRIVLEDEIQYCTNPSFYDQYRMYADTYFRDMSHNADNVQCNGSVLVPIDNGIVRGFYTDWVSGSGPRNQDVIWNFTKDSQVVYDTLGITSGFGEVEVRSMSGSNFSVLNLDSNFKITWKNIDQGNVVLAIGVHYDIRVSENYVTLIPNSGSFLIDKSFLVDNLGANFDVGAKSFSIHLAKVKYKFKNYGINNDKTLLTTFIASTGASIRCD